MEVRVDGVDHLMTIHASYQAVCDVLDDTKTIQIEMELKGMPTISMEAFVTSIGGRLANETDVIFRQPRRG
jgi:hypothetical protein